jgi:hypothetical protein
MPTISRRFGPSTLFGPLGELEGPTSWQGAVGDINSQGLPLGYSDGVV